MRHSVKILGVMLVMTALISSCSESARTQTRYTPAQIAQAIISAQDNISDLEPLLPDDSYFQEYLTNIYKLNSGLIKDGVIYYANGMQADEIAVFLLADNSSVKDISDALVKYKERRSDAFMGYAPVQAAILENGVVTANGDYVALLICEEPQKAESVFMACFSDNPPMINGDLNSLQPDNSIESMSIEPWMEENKPGIENDNAAGTDKPDSMPSENELSGDKQPGDEQENGQPGGDEPINDEPINDEPINDEPTNDEPSIDEPVDDEPVDDQPAYGETANSGEANGEAGDDTAVTVIPANDEPSNDEIADNKPINDTPIDDVAGNEVTENGEPETGETNDEDDAYNPDAILIAWRSGDNSNLSKKNQSILDACVDIINTITTGDMNDYEKELAINDWIVDRVSYDMDAASNSPNARPDPDNDNPYGAIFQRKAICSGYTSTFQLFMDLLGIECISVHGVYKRTGEEHAWNMVRMDGEWYCVDVTWNDPIGGAVTSSMKHRYFNVTTQFMLETGHQWDESTTPVADAGKLYFDR